MVQKADVFKWFYTMRKLKIEKYFSPKEVCKGLNSNGVEVGERSVRRHLWNLERDGFLEAKAEGTWTNWNRRYRLRKEYLVEKVV